MLVAKEWDGVAEYIANGIDRLVAADVDCLVICSNTAHIAVPLVRELHPKLPVLHIADYLEAKGKAYEDAAAQSNGASS